MREVSGFRTGVTDAFPLVGSQAALIGSLCTDISGQSPCPLLKGQGVLFGLFDP